VHWSVDVLMEWVGLRGGSARRRSVTDSCARDTGRDDVVQATASASTTRIPPSVSVHLSRLASTYRGISICMQHANHFSVQKVLQTIDTIKTCRISADILYGRLHDL